METFAPTRFERGRPMLLGGVRRHHPYTEAAGPGMFEQWRQFEALVPIPGQLGATLYGVMCGHDANGFEYMCAAEVDSFAALPAELGRMRIQPQEYAVFVHRDGVATIRATWELILNQWLGHSGYQSAHKPDFEVYDERFDPRTGHGPIEIWISVAREGRRW